MLPVRADRVTISNIQGTSYVSPYLGQFVTDIEGIVTKIDSDRFYLQNPNPDDNIATSEAIVVYTKEFPRTSLGEPIAIGDRVSASGTVNEYISGAEGSNNLSQTEIDVSGNDGAVVKLSGNNPLPDAIALSKSDRTPPDRAIDFYESLESMRVKIEDATVINPTNRYGEFIVVLQEGKPGLSEGDLNPDRLFVKIENSSPPKLQVGDRLQGTIVGILGYDGGNYKLVTDTVPPVKPTS